MNFHNLRHLVKETKKMYSIWPIVVQSLVLIFRLFIWFLKIFLKSTSAIRTYLYWFAHACMSASALFFFLFFFNVWCLWTPDRNILIVFFLTTVMVLENFNFLLLFLFFFFTIVLFVVIIRYFHFALPKICSMFFRNGL